MPSFSISQILISIICLFSVSSVEAKSVPEWDGKLLAGKYSVILHTTKGDISLELDADKAPKAVTNFIGLAKGGYYDKQIFHRVIDGFLIQTGDPSSKGTGGDSIFGEQFENEMNNFHMDRGIVGMANSGKDTNSSQFFILTKYSPYLEGKYTLFGKVTDGMDIVELISKASTSFNYSEKPAKPIYYFVEIKGEKAFTVREKAFLRRFRNTKKLR